MDWSTIPFLKQGRTDEASDELLCLLVQVAPWMGSSPNRRSGTPAVSNQRLGDASSSRGRDCPGIPSKRPAKSRSSTGLLAACLTTEGLHFTFVSEVERGLRNLSLRSVLVLAEGLEIDPAKLVKGLSRRTKAEPHRPDAMIGHD